MKQVLNVSALGVAVALLVPVLAGCGDETYKKTTESTEITEKVKSGAPLISGPPPNMNVGGPGGPGGSMPPMTGPGGAPMTGPPGGAPMSPGMPPGTSR